MPSFSIPLSGLGADSTALNTIANNLSNMNTTAFKSENTNFSDLFYQQIGSNGAGDPIQVGGGTQVASNSTDFTSFAANPTGNATDVALNGDGFFVVQNANGTEYTRNGNFTLSNDGHLTTQSGQQVMGYPAAGGVVNTNAPLAAIQIPKGQVEKPQATTNVGLTANLNAAATVGATSALPAQITVYDSLGEPHIATVTFQKTAQNAWSYSIALPSGESTGGTNTAGTLGFDSTGALSTVNGTSIYNAGPPPTLITPPAANPVGFTGLSDGASNLNFNFSLFGANGQPTLTQEAASISAVSATNANGFASGQYQDFSVGSDGVVSARFSNGQTAAVGQIAVATVTNEQGLSKLGDSNYATTLASGQASNGVAGAGGRGTIQDNALEGSNVDISTQFANLIVAQRAFEANSKAVTTFDTVTQDTINMIH